MQAYGNKLNKILKNAFWRRGDFSNTDKIKGGWLVFFFLNHAEACTVCRLLCLIPVLFGDKLYSF